MIIGWIMFALLIFSNVAVHVIIQRYFEGHEAFNDPAAASPGLRHYEALKVPVY